MTRHLRKHPPAPFTGPIPDGPMSVRAASKILGESAYGVMRLIAEGQLKAQKVHNAAGGTSMQVFGTSVRAYLERQQAAASAPVVPRQVTA